MAGQGLVVTAPAELQTLANGLEVLEALFSHDFRGRTVRELASATGLDPLAVRRVVRTLAGRGWAIEAPPATGSKEAIWRVGDKLALVSESYRRHMLRRLRALEDEFQAMTGEDLR
jgi:DNA-binding IclR family transcriptional regulator